MIKLRIKNETDYIFKYKRQYKKIVKQIAHLEQIKENGQVNLIIIDAAKMKNLYQKYKQENKTTDILSFPADWKHLYPLIGYYEFGDIYICPEQLDLQAIKYDHSQKREWCYIFGHGVFHLLGYDHVNQHDAKIMHNKTETIMKKIKVVRNG